MSEKLTKARTKTFEDFVDKARKIHGEKYTYYKETYKNRRTLTKVTCKNCRTEFWIKPDNHLNHKIGCEKCMRVRWRNKLMTPKRKFLKYAEKTHGDRYTYQNLPEYINTKKKVEIRCEKCKREFKQSAGNHIYLKHGCPFCRESKAENIIYKFLIDNEIEFERQYMFDDCRNPETNRKLKFDFYIPAKNLCIEYDGEHHFRLWRKIESARKKLVTTQYLDGLKNNYCDLNNINLVRINYLEFDKIRDILKDVFKV